MEVETAAGKLTEFVECVDIEEGDTVLEVSVGVSCLRVSIPVTVVVVLLGMLSHRDSVLDVITASPSSTLQLYFFSLPGLLSPLREFSSSLSKELFLIAVTSLQRLEGEVIGSESVSTTSST